MKRKAATLILLMAVALVAGCGGDSDHNAQDVSFARDMVPHHQQAVTMSDLALAQSGNPQVEDLATRIKASQAREISLMEGWLADWGEEATDHSGHDMGEMKSMKGMVSEPDMAALRAAQGPEFDRQFIEHMTAHHQGALEMARVQLDKGKHEPAKELARAIITSQEKEIAEMAKIQSGRPAATP